jgi:hypothetical protein
MGSGRGHDLACVVGAGGLNNGEAQWRAAPITEGQKNYLGYLNMQVTKGMTKGEAFEAISKAKFRAQWQKAMQRIRQRAGAA